MFRRKFAFAAFGILFFGVLIFLVWPSPGRPQVEIDLGDGTTLLLMEVVGGKTLLFHEGSRWQKAVDKIFGDKVNLPEAVTGSVFLMGIADTNGVIALKFRHFSKHGVPLDPTWFPIDFIVQLPPAGSKEADIMPILQSKEPIGATPQTIMQNVIIEFPMSTERELHFRVLEDNGKGLKEWGHDFTIANPVFK